MNCDRCGALANWRANLASGGELLFCSHHARESRDPITAAGGTMVALNQTASATAF